MLCPLVERDPHKRESGGSGLGVAHVWLAGDTDAFMISGRDPLDARTISLEPGSAGTDKPLAVLINGRSASASEIVAGALRDNGRARLVGDAATYGKGRIQTVYSLNDGSALFVTVAQYQTPARHDIDRIGIKPDVLCRPPKAGGDERLRLPVELRGSYGPKPLMEQLVADPCFMAASKVVSAEVANPAAAPQLPQLLATTASGQP